MQIHHWVRKIPCRRAWQATPVSLPAKLHGQRSLEGYSPWGRKESDTTEYTHTKSNYNSCADHLILPGNSAPAALSRENSRRGTAWSKEQSGPGKTEQKQQSVRRGHGSRSEAWDAMGLLLLGVNCVSLSSGSGHLERKRVSFKSLFKNSTH